MRSPNRTLIFGILFALVSLCFTSNASSLPRAEPLENRGYGYNTCSRGDVTALVKILSKYSTVSKNICAKLLHRSPAETVTSKKTTTKTVTSTCTKWTTVTAKQGTPYVGVSSTKTNTLVDTVTATVSTTVTATAMSSEVDTDTITQTVTAAGDTVTVTTTTAAYVYKRNKQPCLGELFPGLPREISAIYADVASQACECFLKPPTTVTVTSTISAHATTTLRKTKAVVVPATTKTTTDARTITLSSTTTATVTAYETATLADYTTTTTTATETATVTPPTATQFVYVNVGCTQISLPANDCVYNRYYDYPDVNNDPTNNYQAATPIGLLSLEDGSETHTVYALNSLYGSDDYYNLREDTHLA
ncbi:hypothetical protein TARUN_6429 [Trichoderma arundinaceum]|uniref:Uncharacterized protein n=1 Tax=Trichoderma arundinaceum TaxID=490622 RepID=A0A395NIS5_TRIAR|nr:hypothetical protein TARUN_6429 [Trichoderma arundinaceum]